VTVSKRTRFEVLRRDDFTCRYCRTTDNPLTVDHVTPVALGGSDDPSNLVTACRDCNYGKGSTGPNETTVAEVSDDAARWSRAIKLASEKAQAADAARDEAVEPFLAEWTSWDKGGSLLPRNWRAILGNYMASGLSPDVLVECAKIAAGNRNVRLNDVFQYMCGVARKKVEQLHERARALLESGEV